jgi:hypothetical protein
MVERFNGRIAEVLQTHHFNSTEALETTLLRYADLYNPAGSIIKCNTGRERRRCCDGQEIRTVEA